MLSLKSTGVNGKYIASWHTRSARKMWGDDKAKAVVVTPSELDSSATCSANGEVANTGRGSVWVGNHDRDRASGCNETARNRNAQLVGIHARGG